MRKIIIRLCLLAGLVLPAGRAAAEEPAAERFRGGSVWLEAGYQTGIEGFDLHGGSLGAGWGYHFNKHLLLGVGFNLNIHSIDRVTSLSVPIFMRVKYTVLKSRVSPYLSVDVGFDPLYSSIKYDMNPEYRPQPGDTWVYGTDMGFYLRPEMGVSYRLKGRRSLNLGVGYTRQRGDFVRIVSAPAGGVEREQHNALHELTFRFGVTF